MNSEIQLPFLLLFFSQTCAIMWCCLFFNFTQFLIEKKKVRFGLGAVRSERFKMQPTVLTGRCLRSAASATDASCHLQQDDRTGLFQDLYSFFIVFPI